MRDGFIKVAAITPEIKVADVDYNSEIICSYMKKAEQEGAKISVFPELCITGYTCQDLFWQDRLLESAKNGLLNIAAYSKGLEGIYFVGLPLSINSKLYNVSAAISQGKILGIVPKIYLPNYNEFYEGRHFASGKHLNTSVEIGNQKVSVSSKLIFKCQEMPSLKIAVELCEDLWVPNPPSISHALAGATVIVNLSASDEITGKSLYRRELVSGQSARLICGYIYASAGNGESTQDVVYSGHNIIAENGKILRSQSFYTGITCSELDLQHIEADRRRMTTFDNNIEDEYAWISFHLQETETKLSRYIDPMPFVPSRVTIK